MLLTYVFMSKVTQKGMKVELTTLRKKSPYLGLFWSAFFPHFPAFGLSVFSPNAGKCRKNADQNNSEYGNFLRSVMQMRDHL